MSLAVVDLTSSQPAAATQGHVASNEVVVLHDEEEEVEEEEDTTASLLLGSLDSSVVGIRYYDGVAYPGEYVQLIREPRNPYDKNAIRVDNQRGMKVGHIKRQIAVALAPIMDKSPHIRVDASIVRPGNEYSLPVLVQFFGAEGCRDQQLIRDSFKRHHQRWTPNPEFTPNQKTPSAKAPPPSVQVSTKTIDWKAESAMDDLFDKITKERMQNLPNLDKPPAITTTLLEHQMEGIRWMYQREQQQEESPFYKQINERGRKVWFCTVTHSTQDQPPKPLRGSILADDMGLGKTLQAIGLILSNPPKPDETNKTTLVVCPVSVMSAWADQIEQHVAPGTLKVGIYTGPNRYDLLTSDNDLDIIITSYGTLSYDFGLEMPNEQKPNQPPKKKKARKQKGPSIFARNFRRIILDEAHTIRNSKSRIFRACKALQATYRLCITGTPIQNKPDDTRALLSFLNVEPLGDAQIFRRAISQPMQNDDSSVAGLALLRTMMAFVALRRPKSKLQMVPKTVQVRSIEFPSDSSHKGIHDVLHDSAKAVFKATLTTASGLQHYTAILETLMRIRQACLSGKLVPKERLAAAEQVLKDVQNKNRPLTAEEGSALLQKLKNALQEDNDTFECGICLEELGQEAAVVLRTCSHVFCGPCLTRVSVQCNGICPMCRKPYTPTDMIKRDLAEAAVSQDDGDAVLLSESLDDLGPPPKLVALLQAIGEMQPDEKGVIFSQFTKFLDIIEPFLTEHGYTFCRIDGSKSAKQRIAAMKRFDDDEGPRFILCSLHAAGTGISLTRGNHCFLMDSWWNENLENQAMDRVHRISSTRPVRVVRFIMKGSIEEKMLELQQTKTLLGKGAMEKLSAEEKRKARMSALKSLFSIRDS